MADSYEMISKSCKAQTFQMEHVALWKPCLRLPREVPWDIRHFVLYVQQENRGQSDGYLDAESNKDEKINKNYKSHALA